MSDTPVIKKLRTRRPDEKRKRRMPPTADLKAIFRLFILPYAAVYRFINEEFLTYLESIQMFFQTYKVGVYACEVERDFFIPGRAWVDSPFHPTITQAPRRAKSGDKLFIRVEYDNNIVDVEYNEVVFRMDMAQFDCIKGKVVFKW